MSWIALTLLGAIFGSLSRILQKILLTNKSGDPFAFSFVFQILVALLFLTYSLSTNAFETPDLSGLGINMIVMTIFYSLGNIFTFKAFETTDASEVAVIFASNSVWAIIAAILMLGERLTLSNIIGIGLIIAGIVAINITGSKWHLSRGHLYGLLGAMLFGIAFTNDAYIIGRYNSISSYMVFAFTMPALLTLLLKPNSIKKIPTYFEFQTVGKILILTIIYAASAQAIFSAYKLGGPASIISPLQQLSIILTTILGYFFLSERDKLPQKVIGSILAFGGAILLI